MRKKLVVADLANIEGRMLSWVSREEWKLQAFYDFDTILRIENGKPVRKGPDLYNVTAVSILGGDPWTVNKKNRNVFGKVPDLACLTADTKVLTHRGLVAIVEVLKTDKLWDGEAWVNHEGLKDNGVRSVVDVDGIRATPDHLINTQGTWRQAQELVSNASFRSQALETGSAALRSLMWFSAKPVGSKLSKSSASADTDHTSSLKPIFEQEKARLAIRARSNVLFGHEKSTGVTKPSAPMRITDDDCSTGLPQRSTGVGTLTTRRTRITEHEAFACTNRGSPTEHSFSDISSHYLDGTSQLSNSTVNPSTEGTSPTTCGSLRNERIGGTNELYARCRTKCSNFENVYDLLNAGPKNRFLVKSNSGWLLVHNSGYMGGVAGYQTFARAYGVRMADHWDVIQQAVGDALVEKAQNNLASWGRPQLVSLEISETEWLASEACKLAWRKRHPATVKFWYDLQRAARDAITNPGIVYVVGQYLKVSCREHHGNLWLLVKLPSGRYLTYFDPRLIEDGRGGAITYMGEATEEGGTNRMWRRVFTHGGKMTGNVCQTLARDVLMPGLLEAERQGYMPVLSVHDEALTETPDTDEYTAAGLVKILATNPPWATGLPLAAEGFETYRYFKD